MDKEILYEVRNIHCQYRSSTRPVLQLDELNIYRGQVYFIVGASGVGKSTILETLGLMNNTIVCSNNSVMTFHGQTGTEDLTSIWSKKEQDQANFRKKYLSFIFQSTNLFLNLTAYENASISQVLHGKRLDEARLKARQLLSKMFPKDFVKEIVNGKKVVEMSGGQRQRLAFCRALGTDYSILFADEPTGNLDYNNAQKLLQTLAEIVKNDNRTAVIVSHDIDLAVKYADTIILIRKELVESSEVTHSMGVVDHASFFNRATENWNNSSSQQPIPPHDLVTLLKEAIRDN
jgi:putative ABC transport system ATP-binding protein